MINEHFLKMMNSNHYILCDSFFVIWSIILNNNENKYKIIIVYNKFLDNLETN